MTLVMLTRVIAPSNIQAIKVLRAATAPALGLKEAKAIHDAVAAGHAYTMELPREAVSEVKKAFDLVEISPAGGGIDRDDVLCFMLDVLAFSEPSSARALMELPSYQRLAEALR